MKNKGTAVNFAISGILLAAVTAVAALQLDLWTLENDVIYVHRAVAAIKVVEGVGSLKEGQYGLLIEHVGSHGNTHWVGTVDKNSKSNYVSLNKTNSSFKKVLKKKAGLFKIQSGTKKAIKGRLTLTVGSQGDKESDTVNAKARNLGE